MRARRAFRLTGVTAARFLRKQEDEGYETGGSLPRPYVAVVASLLAEPECGEPTVSMDEALVGSEGEFLLQEALCLKEPSEATSILKEMNPRFSKVLGARQEYISYLHRPICRELWDFRLASEARGTLSLAAVPKKLGPQQRNILMTCPFNEALRPVDSILEGGFNYGMHAGAALAQVQVPSDELAFASADQGNAFTHVIVPAWWRPFMAGPKVRAAEVREIVGDLFAPDVWLRPQYRRLPMGHIFAVLALSCINARILASVRASWSHMGKLFVLNEASTLQEGVVVSGYDAAVYVHVDDFGVSAASDSTADAVCTLIRQESGRVGLPAGMKRSGEVDSYIGLVPVRSLAGWRPRREKLGAVDMALGDLLAAGYVSMAWLHQVVAQFVYLSLLWRPGLSAVHAVYRQIRLGGWQKLWPSTRQELHYMRGLLPFLYCDLARCSIPVAFAQDAAGATSPQGLSPTGAFCLAGGRVPRTEIETVLDRREVRSKVIVPSSIMQLTPATLGEIRSEGALGRTVLPLAWFSEGADWEQVLARKWRWSLPIHCAEAHASVIWLRVAVMSGLPSRSRALDIGDNLAHVCAFVRGRAHDFELNAQCRRRASLEALGDLSWHAAWADTTHQPSDSGTRPDSVGKLHIARPLWLAAQLFLEVFAGTARVTAAFRRTDRFRERTLDPWDVLYGSKYDLLVPNNVRRLLSLIASGHVEGVWLGTPCTSFTLARRWDGGPPPLRSPTDVLCPAPWIHVEKDLKAISDGNALAAVSVRVMLVAYQARCWCVLENGVRSRLWEVQSIQEALLATRASSVTAEYCCFRLETDSEAVAPWRKSTRFEGTLPGLEALGRQRCRNVRLCDVTGRPHIRLSGRNEAGVWRTKLAEPYPVGLCDTVAHLACAHGAHSAAR